MRFRSFKSTYFLYGCRRTDTGVHAKEMYVHFDWKRNCYFSNVKDLDHLVHRLNRFLDPAIRILKL